MKASDLPKIKLDSWKQDQPDQQFVVILQNIIGLAMNIQEFTSPADMDNIRRGGKIQESAEELMKLYPWVEKKW